MKRVLKWVGIGLAGVVVLALVAAGAGYVLLRNTVPSPSGSLAIAGLSAPVEVVRDKEGVPHIFAKSMGDLFARSASCTRRTACGRWSCCAAPARAACPRSSASAPTPPTCSCARSTSTAMPSAPLEVLPPAARWNLEAYARGVNAFLTRPTGWLEPRLPPEFLILRHKPEPWRPADSVVAVKLMALNLSTNLDFEMMRLELAAQGLSSGGDRGPDAA